MNYSYFAGFIVCLILLTSGAWAITDANLTAYYNFNETSGDLIDQKGTFDGTNTNITQGSTGLLQNSYTYTNNGTYTTFSTLNTPTTKGTWSMWIYPTNACNGVSCYLFGTAPAEVGELQVYMRDGKFCSGVGGAWASCTTTYGALNLNQWNLVQLTWAGTGQVFKRYVNNVVADDSATYTGSLIYTAPYLGRDGTQAYAGRIDEFGIFNEVLSTTDLNSLYNSGTGLTYCSGTNSFAEQCVGVTSNFTYTKNGLDVNLFDASTTIGDLAIDSWEWLIDDASVSTDQNYGFTGIESTDYNVCLIVEDSTNTYQSSSCQTISLQDVTPPVTTFSSFQVAGTTDQNITLTCTDNNTGCKTINYNIDNNTWIQFLGNELNDTNLKSWFRFDETNGTTAIDSAGNNIGTSTAGVTVNESGKNIKAYALASGSKVDFGSGALDINGAITINAWIKGGVQADSTNAYIVMMPSSTAYKYSLEINTYTNQLYFQIGDTEKAIANSGYPQDNQWHMVTGTWTGAVGAGNMKIYLDGVLQTDTGTGNNQGVSTGSARVGKRDDGYGGYVGTVDEVGIWNRALTQEDITALYNTVFGNVISINTSVNFLYSGTGDHNIQYFSTDNSDNNETTKSSQFPMFSYSNEQTNSRVLLIGVGQYNGYSVTSWLYHVNGTPLAGTTDQNKYYYTQANLDLNVCLTTNNTDTTCRSIKTWDTISPTIDVNVVNSSYGFVSTFDLNYNMICYDNFSPIQYTITWNNGTTNTTLYNSSDANATLKTGTLDLNAGQNATMTFTCTDDSGNQATYTSQRVYAILFRLINEATGATLTWADLNANLATAKVYTLDGNYSYDFNSSGTSSVNFFSPTENLYFEFGYKDTSQTKISRQIDFGLLTDSNIGVCVPFFQTFYQQRFVANTAREMVLQNKVSNCYVIASTLEYVYDTGYSITTYTIPKPYYLYVWIDGVKTFLAFIDGAVATQYNLDAIAFSRTAFNIVTGQDTVGFQPLINTVTNKYDTNTIMIYYKSSSQDNTQTRFQIKNGSESIWDYTETGSPNEVLINFYWGGLGISDQNVLELIVTTTDSDGTTVSKSYYFTVYGNYYPNEGANSWVVIVAILFFLFGITLVAASRAFGIFGIIICIICLGITATASGAWWISLLQGVFLVLMVYIIMMGKTTQGQTA